jgi:diguanylate cyclase (GGDEF)-like protein
LVLITAAAFTVYDLLYLEPILDIRVFNLVIEMSFALMSLTLFLSIDSLKGKTFYNFLSAGFYLVYISMLVDGLDQLHLHNEFYTAVWEKTTLLFGFTFVFIGVKNWIVDHANLNKELAVQAITDDLTGLYNRRGILKKFEFLNEQAELRHKTLSFIIIDLDDFKLYNDAMGHLSGDEFLADLGNTLYQMVDDNQVIGRWGGEEFAVGMLGSDLNEALLFAEQIRAAVVNIPIPDAIDKQSVTASLGVAQKMPQEPYMLALKRADRSLYVAKQKGKNQSIAN